MFDPLQQKTLNPEELISTVNGGGCCQKIRYYILIKSFENALLR